MQNQRITLYALLHDIGKLLQRALRENENVRSMNELLKNTYACYDEYTKKIKKLWPGSYDHDILSACFISTILNEDPMKIFKELETIYSEVSYADEFIAAERGLEIYPFSREVVSIITKKLFESLKKEFNSLNLDFDIHKVPMLSPLWLVHIAGYRKGLCLPREIDLIKGLEKSGFLDILTKIYEFKTKGYNEVFDEIAKMILKLAKEKLWYPVKPLSNSYIVEFRGLSFREAQKLNNYLEVAKSFADDTTKLMYLYGTKHNYTRSFIETLSKIIERNLTFVPAAVYGTIAPDTSLAMHSKAVATIAEALRRSNIKSFHILAINFIGIQRFVSSITKAKLASKVLRGRSLLLELVQRAITNYVAELFDISPINMLVEEGGAPRYIIPAIEDLSNRVKILKMILDEVSYHELNGELHFAVAVSEPITKEHSRFLRSFVEPQKPSLANELRKLDIQLAIEKRRIYSTSINKLRPINKPRYDTLLQSFVSVSDSFDIDINNNEKLRYVSSFAPEALEIGDFLSGHMHRIAVLGHIARNLIMLIEIYAYNKGNNFTKPSSKFIVDLTKEIAYRLNAKEYMLYVRSFNISGENHSKEYRIAMISLQNLGALYIAISHTKIYRENVKSHLWDYIKILVKHVLKEAIETIKAKYGETKVYIKFISVNDVETFLPNYRINLGKDIEISYGYFFTNTYFFMKVEKEHDEREITARPASVEELNIPLLALTKIDGDAVGSVVYVLGRSPTRIATLSLFLTLIFGARAYLKLIDEALRIFKQKCSQFSGVEQLKCFERIQPRIAILYGGGDDIVIFGDWIETIKFIIKISKDLDEILKPLTISAGIYFDRIETPIVELYRNTLELLEDAKEAGGASIRLPCPSIKQCNDNIVKVLTLKELNKLLSTLINTLNNLDLIPRGLLYSLVKLSRRCVDAFEKPIENLDFEKARIYIDYVYLWNRRRDDLENMCKLLGLNKLIPTVSNDAMPKINDVIESLAHIYPYISYAYLIIRLSS